MVFFFFCVKRSNKKWVSMNERIHSSRKCSQRVQLNHSGYNKTNTFFILVIYSDQV